MKKQILIFVVVGLMLAAPSYAFIPNDTQLFQQDYAQEEFPPFQQGQILFFAPLLLQHKLFLFPFQDYKNIFQHGGVCLKISTISLISEKAFVNLAVAWPNSKKLIEIDIE